MYRMTDTHFPMGGTYFQAARILAQLIDDIDHACCSMLFAEFCTFKSLEIERRLPRAPELELEMSR
jgi:hypothetical protein